MKTFKFLTENIKPIWLPTIYEEMVVAIIKNQYRNGFAILGAWHRFRDSQHFYYRLEILEIRREGGWNMISYKVDNITLHEEKHFGMDMSDYQWNRQIES